MQHFHWHLVRAATVATTVVIGGTVFAGTAHAVPIETFYLDQTQVAGGVPGGNAGTVTLLQLNLSEVRVTVSVAPNLIINTSNGNTHTPFAFNLTSAAATSVNNTQGIFIETPYCTPSTTCLMTPAYGDGLVKPYGTMNEAILYSAGNGAGNGYGGDLVFTVTGAGVGNVTPDGYFSAFAPNSAGAIFAADLYNTATGKTGTFAAFAGVPGDNGGIITPPSNSSVPEPMSMLLLGSGLLALGGAKLRLRPARHD
ncbi:MAG: hypothetical protein J0H91_09120 [Rhodospirillales bacterium]|nr:hypothetical protein [Rhodospirillales bacterium]